MLRGCLQNDRKLFSFTENSTPDLIDTDWWFRLEHSLEHDLTPLLRLWRYVEHIPEVQLQMMVVQDSPSTWNTQQDCSLFDPADERKILSLTLKFQPDKTNLVQIQQQFRQQAILSQAIEVGIKPDMTTIV